MPDLPFPLNSTPGHLPGEGEGRHINSYPEKAGDKVYIRRVPGLVTLADAGGSNPRGLVDLNGDIYAAYTGKVVRKMAAGSVSMLNGSIPGTDGVTWGRNNRTTSGAATPDLVAVREGGGAYIVSSTAVTTYPDSDLPATVNSVTSMSSFLLFTNPDGRIFASELNSTDQSALSFATAEALPDKLKRGIVNSGTFYAMGEDSIEPWNNIGASPFPLARVPSVIPVGLLTTMAVAGFEEGWNRFPIFVAHDGTVRELRGYDTAIISNPDVERFIAGSTVSTLEASVYTARGHAFFALSSDAGTWEYDVREQSWHERLSEGLNRWRGSRSVKSNGQWVVGDLSSTNLLAISDSAFDEAGDPLVWTIESGPMKGFPARVSVPAVFADFTQAGAADALVDENGNLLVITIENGPLAGSLAQLVMPGGGASVAISWSHNGGQTFSVPVLRSLAQADRYPVRVNRLGLSTHHGMRLRLSISDPVDFAFMGASVPEPLTRKP